MSYPVQPNVAMLAQPGGWNVQGAPVAPQPQVLMSQGQLPQPQLMPATGVMNPMYAQAMPVQGQQQLPAVAPWGMQQQPVYVSSMSQIPQGAIPVSQAMLAQALGQAQMGAQVVQPESASPIKSALKGAGIGAAAGAAFGIIPFLPLGLFSGALVGAAAGAAIGLVRGMKAKKAEGEFHTMEQQQAQAAAMAQAQMIASTPPGARSSVAAEAKPVVKAVHMSPETRKKWAAKVAAEKAAAAKKH
ncbi:MAG: hypothetical protein JWM86_2128 [Thermoleophilia bacterium]|nr:hypothetical protein [Thermoleophilia bacterium]